MSCMQLRRFLSYTEPEGGLEAVAGMWGAMHTLQQPCCTDRQHWALLVPKLRAHSFPCWIKDDKNLYNLGLISLNKASQCNYFIKNRTCKTSWILVKLKSHITIIYFSLFLCQEEEKKVLKCVCTYVGECHLKAHLWVSTVLEARRNHINSKWRPINKFISKVHTHIYARLQLIAIFALFIQKSNKIQQYFYLVLYKQLLWAEGKIWC